MNFHKLNGRLAATVSLLAAFGLATLTDAQFGGLSWEKGRNPPQGLRKRTERRARYPGTWEYLSLSTRKKIFEVVWG